MGTSRTGNANRIVTEDGHIKVVLSCGQVEGHHDPQLVNLFHLRIAS